MVGPHCLKLIKIIIIFKFGITFFLICLARRSYKIYLFTRKKRIIRKSEQYFNIFLKKQQQI